MLMMRPYSALGTPQKPNICSWDFLKGDGGQNGAHDAFLGGAWFPSCGGDFLRKRVSGSCGEKRRSDEAGSAALAFAPSQSSGCWPAPAMQGVARFRGCARCGQRRTGLFRVTIARSEACSSGRSTEAKQQAIQVVVAARRHNGFHAFFAETRFMPRCRSRKARSASYTAENAVVEGA